MNKLTTALSERLATEVFPDLLATIPWSLLMLAAFIITLIYCGNLKKDATTKGSGLAVTALILSIVRFVLFAPINNFALLLGNGTAETQASWDPIYYLFSIIPLALLAIKGILALTAPKAAPVAEAPAAETPIVEAAPAAETEPAPAAEEKAE